MKGQAAVVSSPYTNEFFSERQPGSVRSAQVIVPLLVDLLGPHSVVDVGCALGSWLSEFRRRGVTDIVGLDGDWVDPGRLEIPTESFIRADLRQPITLNRRFDLAISLEVAEHLPADCAKPFVASLVGLAPIVAFSAAIPFQGGTDHLNEQWPAYWVQLFGEFDYTPIDCIRPRVWDRPDTEVCYAQNLLLFLSRPELERRCDLLRTAGNAPPLSLVHPRKYLQLNRLYEEALFRSLPENMALQQFVRAAPQVLFGFLKRRFGSARPVRQHAPRSNGQ
jgi:hypothetical protein